MIYLDANVVIRLVEGNAAARAPVEQRLRAAAAAGDADLATSKLSRVECRCKPLQTGDAAVLGMYDVFFAGAELRLLDVDDAVIEKTTELRAALNVKTPDGIHLASAIVAGASVFLTGDRDLARCRDVNVEIV